jgi:hypothetical protein
VGRIGFVRDSRLHGVDGMLTCGRECVYGPVRDTHLVAALSIIFVVARDIEAPRDAPRFQPIGEQVTSLLTQLVAGVLPLPFPERVQALIIQLLDGSGRYVDVFHHPAVAPEGAIGESRQFVGACRRSEIIICHA